MKSKPGRKQRAKPKLLRSSDDLGNSTCDQASSSMSTAAEAAKIVASKRDCASGPDPKSADPKATARRAKLLSGAQAREARIRLLVGPLIEQPERAQPAATRDMAASPEASALTCVSEPKQRL